ncbi:ATPase inhibitor mai-1, mitochondrial-like [Paramacrobiotus metropolitanus]|uniref:ATPase inhibitor mai-1, mitochondrial-like n=1 Tax=Paramacrobiotus metropolitanus TaxID=2943436 RepID=UPI002445C7B6|nr:ATPase inhibitor mai-1, mitochondrial-like [Paramacrobiotus metropolitanus]
MALRCMNSSSVLRARLGLQLARGMASGEWGSGAGKGGGGGGSIREAGGAMGKIEAAREEEFFRKLQKQQLDDYKGHLNTEIKFHEEQIRAHKDAIERHKEAAKKAEQDARKQAALDRDGSR